MITDLGKSITASLSRLFTTNITEDSIKNIIDDICTSLIHSNVNQKYVQKIKENLYKKILEKNIQGFNKQKVVETAVFEELVSLIDPKIKPFEIIKGKSNVVVFVGLQGAGKTTSICKYANYYKKKGLKVGLVCADTFRAGAFEQIKQNALKIKVPFYGNDEADPVVVALEGVSRFKKEDFDLICVDTSGRHTQEKDLFVEMTDIINAVVPDNIVFVMDAGIGQSSEDQALGFKNSVNVGSIIITKIDGTTKAGGAISSVAVTQCPILFVGTGENMEDFEIFEPKGFVGRMLGMGDLHGLSKKISDLKIDEKELMNKFQKGTFTLNDFSVQFKQLLSLGPMSKLLEMLPGGGGFQMPDEKRFKKLICILDSFSKSELDSDGTVIEKERSRILRIAKGSASAPQEVMELLVQFKNMSNMMKKFANVPGYGDLIGKDPNTLSESQKAKFKQQAKGLLPKDMLDTMSRFL
ncbi:signal recognition particle 54 kDa (SRP54) [Vairimorpha necatrix]|uniref:signal-recognition-particle GTPase n=1 Tax=Vairimorpha necatrix TaxID=6039 RepID=A0AAX4JBH8_9MICR